MWFVTAVTCLNIVRQLACRPWAPRHKLTSPNSRIDEASEPLSAASLRTLSTFFVVCLLIQTFSLAGSSYAEEEHQLWYYFSASGLILCATFVLFGNHSRMVKRSTLSPVIIILFLDRLFLRRMHQTGDRWIHLPDLSDWLYSPEHAVWLWPAQLTQWCALICLRWFAIERHSQVFKVFGKSKPLQYSPVLSTLTIAGVQMYYRWNVDSGYKYTAVVSARVVFLLLLLDCVVALHWRRTYHSLRRLLPRSEDLPLCDCWTGGVIHPFNTFPMLICILGRTTVGILWIGIMIKEVLLACFFQRFCRDFKSSSPKLFGLQFNCVWLMYWIQGWASFFQQGNSLSLATIDVSAAYVGLQTYQPVVCGLLLTIYTYAGPIYWQLAYTARYSAFEIIIGASSNRTYFRLGLAVLPITFCATVCFVLRSHLFIWTVFTPKLLYLAVFYAAYVPIFLFCSAMHL